MVTYPIRVERSSYRGADPKKRQKAMLENQSAVALETYINKQLLEQTSPIQVYTYARIAAQTGYPEKTVRDLCGLIDGGGNGFTAIKHGITYEDAMSAHQRGE